MVGQVESLNNNPERLSANAGSGAALPLSRFLPRVLSTRYASLGTAALLSVMAVRSNAQQNQDSRVIPVNFTPNTQVVSASPKQVIVKEFEKLRSGLAEATSNKEALVKDFVKTCFTPAAGKESLALQLKSQEPKLYESMLLSLGKMLGSSDRVAELIKEVLSPTAVVAGHPELNSQTRSLAVRPLVQQFDPKLVPHCQQGSGTSLCGVSSSLTVAQIYFGLDLSSKDSLLRITNIKSDLVMSGKSGLFPKEIFDLLGIDSQEVDFAKDKNFNNREEASAYAREVILGEVIPVLKQNRLANVEVQAGKLTHAIAILGYDEQSKTFIVSNPGRSSITTLSLDDLAKQWPSRTSTSIKTELKITFLTKEIPVSSMSGGLAKDLPSSSQVVLSDSCERLVAQGNNLKPATLFLPHVKSAYPDIKWSNVAYNWETGRDAEKVFGLPWLVKLNLSLKENDKFVCAIFPAGANSCQLVIVKGFKDGPTGEPFDGTFEIQTKNGTETISYLEFNKRCAAFKSSNGVGTFAYVGYLPNNSQGNIAKMETASATPVRASVAP